MAHKDFLKCLWPGANKSVTYKSKIKVMILLVILM